MAGLMLVAIFATFALAACGDDEDEPADPATHDPELVGVWESEDGYWGGSWNKLAIYTNGKYRLDAKEGQQSYWYAGRWEAEDGDLILHYDSASDGENQGESERCFYSVGEDGCIWICGHRYDPVE